MRAYAQKALRPLLIAYAAARMHVTFIIMSCGGEQQELHSGEECKDAGEDESGPSTSYSSRSSSVSDSTDVPLLLSRLKQAPLSGTNRKRKVAQNLPTERKRYKPLSHLNDPKRITPEQRLSKFPDQKFVVSRGKLFCTACREEVALKKSVVELHVKSEKHKKGKIKLAMKEKREQDIVKALGAYDEEVHLVGETLPTDQCVFRIRVVSTFLKAGVPLCKIDQFRDILEEGGGYCLAERCPMSNLIPFILLEEKHRLREELNGKDVAVIFDGTSRLGEALVVVLRFMHDWYPEQRLTS